MSRVLFLIQLPAQPTDAEFNEASGILQLLKNNGIANITTPAAVTAATTMTVDAKSAAGADSDDEEGGDTNTTGFDSKGRAWDERIHSGSKKTNADGTWRYRKGADKSLVSKIEAEQDAARGATAPTAAPSLPVPGAVAPSLPVPGAAPSLPLPTPVRTEYEKLVDFLANNSALTPEYMDDYFKSCNVTGGLPSLAANNEFCAQIREQLKGVLVGAGVAVVE